MAVIIPRIQGGLKILHFLRGFALTVPSPRVDNRLHAMETARSTKPGGRTHGHGHPGGGEDRNVVKCKRTRLSCQDL